jgi:hypothetical protein
MSSEHTLHRTTLAVAVAVMFVLFKHTRLFADPNYELLALAVSVLAGTGLHEALTRAIELALNHFKRLRRQMLGSSYIEGKWSGFYLGTNDHPRFIIQTMRQEWSRVYINGQAFTHQATPHGQWHSVSATVDGRAGLLHGVFSGDNTNGHYDSVFSFQLEGDPPTTLSGYLYDSSTSTSVGQAWTIMERLRGDLTDRAAMANAHRLYRQAAESGMIKGERGDSKPGEPGTSAVSLSTGGTGAPVAGAPIAALATPRPGG